MKNNLCYGVDCDDEQCRCNQVENDDFIFAKFGEKVSWLGSKATVVGFDPSAKLLDTKIVFQGGEVRWVNRKKLEDLNRALELEAAGDLKEYKLKY